MNEDFYTYLDEQVTNITTALMAIRDIATYTDIPINMHFDSHVITVTVNFEKWNAKSEHFYLQDMYRYHQTRDMIYKWIKGAVEEIVKSKEEYFMKIVDFKTFNRMPAGTIFAPYTPCVLEEGLAIKVDHGRGLNPMFYNFDWVFNGIMPLEPWNLDSIFDEESVRATFEIYDGDSNDYIGYEQFLIFEECDIDRLIQVLQWAKGGCKDEDYKGFDEW